MNNILKRERGKVGDDEVGEEREIWGGGETKRKK